MITMNGIRSIPSSVFRFPFWSIFWLVAFWNATSIGVKSIVANPKFRIERFRPLDETNFSLHQLIRRPTLELFYDLKLLDGQLWLSSDHCPIIQLTL